MPARELADSPRFARNARLKKRLEMHWRLSWKTLAPIRNNSLSQSERNGKARKESVLVLSSRFGIQSPARGIE